MNKKFLFAAAIMLIAAALLLTACGGGKELTVNFDSNGGTPVGSITVKQGENVNAPADPEKTGYEFRGWRQGVKRASKTSRRERV